MSDESIDEEEGEVWSHGHDREVRGPELLFAALHGESLRNMPELYSRLIRQALNNKLMSILISKFC